MIDVACATSLTFPVYIDANTNEDDSSDANDDDAIDKVFTDSITVDTKMTDETLNTSQYEETDAFSAEDSDVVDNELNEEKEMT